MDNISEQSNFVNPLPVAPAKKSGGKLVKIIIILAALGIIGGGAALATRVWDPLWNPFRPSPEKVLALMFEKMQAVKSSHFDMKIDIDMKSPNPGKITISFSGDSDINNPEEAKAEGDFQMLFTGQIGTGTAESVSLKAKIKMIGKDGYFNISEFNAPSLAFLFLMMGIDLNSLTGVWINVPLEGSSNTQAAALTGEMQKMISESNVYIIKKQLPDQKVEGQKMYHYLIALDNDRFVQLVADLTGEIMKQSAQMMPETSMMPDTLAIKTTMLEILNKLGEISAEFLIGKNDYFLYSLKMEKNIDLSKIDERAGGTYDIGFEITNSKFNQPVKIEAPASFKTFEEVFPQLQGLPLLLGTGEQ